MDQTTTTMEQGEESLDIYMSSLRWPRLILVHMALRAAIELKVFDIISSKGPNAKLTAYEIVSHIPTKNHPNAAANALDRILRYLTINSILTASSRPCGNKVEKAYALTPESRLLVSHNQGMTTSLSAVVLLSSEKESVDCLYGLKDAVLEPNRLPLYNAFHGVSFFEDASQKPRLNKLFNESMADYSNTYMDKVLKSYKGFQGLVEVMDVGGGSGAAIQKIVAACPKIRGINFDMPHVIADAPPNYLGIENVAGDMFKSLPKAQAIMLKNVLHDWDDDECVKILWNCSEALPGNGKVIVLENVIPQELGSNLESLEVISLDATMMTYIGGKERTKTEFDNLATRAGFDETKMFPVGRGFHVMEFIKKTTTKTQ